MIILQQGNIDFPVNKSAATGLKYRESAYSVSAINGQRVVLEKLAKKRGPKV